MHTRITFLIYKINERSLYTQRNLIKSNQNQIVYTIFLLIWNETGIHLVPNQWQIQSDFGLIQCDFSACTHLDVRVDGTTDRMRPQRSDPSLYRHVKDARHSILSSATQFLHGDGQVFLLESLYICMYI